MGDKYRAKSGNGNAKGTNRGNFQQKGFTAGQTPGLYVLHYDESAHMGLRIEKYHKSLVIYVRKEGYFPGIEKCLDAENPEYPTIEEPEDPGDKCGQVEKIKFTEKYKAYLSDCRKLEEDKIRLHGVMVRQCTDQSADQIRMTEAGIKALDKETKPLTLMREIRSTHLGPSLVDSKISFYTAQSAYEDIHMDNRESLNRHKEVIEASYARFKAAATKAHEDYPTEGFQTKIPSESMMAMKFVMTLPPKYGVYKRKVLRGEKDMLDTIKVAFDDVSKHGEEYVQRDMKHQTINTARHGHAGNGNGDRNKRNKEGKSEVAGKKVVAGVDGKVMEHIRCNFKGCGDYGHMMRVCPIRASRDAQRAADDEQSIGNVVKQIKKEEQFKLVGGGAAKQVAFESKPSK
jgi:hypothetical protein